MMENWKTIESCPEGEWVLVYRSDSKSVEIDYSKDFHHYIGNPELAYTHWMPLPKGPH